MSHVEENLAHSLPQRVIQDDFIELWEFLGVTIVGQSAHLWTVLEIEPGLLEDPVQEIKEKGYSDDHVEVL
jgi:hypothetical protein